MKYFKFGVDSAGVNYPQFKEITLFYRHIKIQNFDINPIEIYLQGELIAEIDGQSEQTFLDFNNEPTKDKYFNHSIYMQGKIIKVVSTNLNQIVKVYNYGI